MQARFIAPQAAEWGEAIATSEWDAYQLPAYLELWARFEEATPAAFCTKVNGKVTCVIPLLLKELGRNSGSCELHSPYGYPGMLWATDAQAQEVFDVLLHFGRAARELGASLAFLRMHPLQRTPAVLPPDTSMVYHGDVVVMDLSSGLDEMWKGFRKSHRYDIRKLTEAGFKTAFDEWELLGEFVRLYNDTMSRIHAGQFYRFPEKFFQRLMFQLPENIHLAAVRAPGGEVAAAALFLSGKKVLSYYLSASDPRFNRWAPTKLLIYDMAVWGKGKGYRSLLLGGGVGASHDSLYEFKAGFSALTKPFHTVRMILDRSGYEALSRAAGHEPNVERDLSAKYFPPFLASTGGGDGD